LICSSEKQKYFFQMGWTDEMTDLMTDLPVGQISARIPNVGAAAMSAKR
jgi:hypothetical protein